MLVLEYRLINLSGNRVRKRIKEMITGGVRIKSGRWMVGVGHGQEADDRLYQPARLEAGIERGIPE